VKGDLGELRPVLDRVVSWARAERNVRAVDLAGSWARNEAHDDSDIDLIILVRSRDALIEDTRWVGRFGTPECVELEDWNAIQSVRVRYDDSREIEFGLGALAWADPSPVDPGTRSVLKAGFVVLYDPDLLMAKLLKAAEGPRRS
jgi:aminoglycoside 6-adenylyltransferase